MRRVELFNIKNKGFISQFTRKMQWYGVNGIRRRSERESRGGGYCVWMNVIRQKANLSERLVKGRGICTTPRDWWKLGCFVLVFFQKTISLCASNPSIHTYFHPTQLFDVIHTQLLHKQP